VRDSVSVFENGRPTESFALRHGSFSFEQGDEQLLRNDLSGETPTGYDAAGDVARDPGKKTGSDRLHRLTPHHLVKITQGSYRTQ
jgi:hypothetical protein